MNIAILIVAIVPSLFASIAAFVMGSGFLVALAIYAGTGVLVLLSIVALAMLSAIGDRSHGESAAEMFSTVVHRSHRL